MISSVKHASSLSRNPGHCITYFKSIHPRSETLPLPRTLPLITHKKVPAISFVHQSTFCRLLLWPCRRYHCGGLVTCPSVPVGCRLPHSSLCPQCLPGPGAWLTCTGVSELNTTENFPFTQCSSGLNIPVTHAPTCFAALDGKGKLQALCKFSSQKSLWEKHILKSSFKKAFLFLMDLEAKKK